MITPNCILILAPHTDDGELGCGGAIAKYCDAGIKVFYAAFADCKQSLPAGLPPDTLRHECKKATALLGIKESHLIFFDFEVRNFQAHRQQILEELVKLNKTIQPDLVFIPASSDIHQDHEVIHTETKRAFKNCSLFGYELPWNNSVFNTSCFIKLSEKDIESKLNSLKAYNSQSQRIYFKNEFLLSLARVRGVQCGAEFAEAFQVLKMIS